MGYSVGEPVSHMKRIIHRKGFAALQRLASHRSLSASKYCHVTAFGPSQRWTPSQHGELGCYCCKIELSCCRHRFSANRHYLPFA